MRYLLATLGAIALPHISYSGFLLRSCAFSGCTIDRQSCHINVFACDFLGPLVCQHLASVGGLALVLNHV